MKILKRDCRHCRPKSFDFSRLDVYGKSADAVQRRPTTVEPRSGHRRDHQRPDARRPARPARPGEVEGSNRGRGALRRRAPPLAHPRAAKAPRRRARAVGGRGSNLYTLPRRDRPPTPFFGTAKLIGKIPGSVSGPRPGALHVGPRGDGHTTRVDQCEDGSRRRIT